MMMIVMILGAPLLFLSTAWTRDYFDDDRKDMMMMIIIIIFILGAPLPTRSTAWTGEMVAQNTGPVTLGRAELLLGWLLLSLSSSSG